MGGFGVTAVANYSITLNACFNTSIISGFGAGGITGSNFGYNTTTNGCKVSNCYSIGDIKSEQAGGIVGANVGYTINASYNPIIDISNCYSLGSVFQKSGGICGGTIPASSYVGNPTINIKNCYSYGVLVDASSGIVSIDYPKATIKLNCYVGNGTWSDVDARNSLSGYPTDININNPGTTWTTLSTSFTPNIPYVLSVFNAQLYTPNSASSASNYSTLPGLFQPDFNYKIIYAKQPHLSNYYLRYNNLI